ncbi:hypothetical protein [Thermocoleostomius sinensis]|jgi:hypothetical protein|uniref:Uncharacterized protein n=1 Tax=Thermocoleostomius sinensis A174 TaxID=2016057 RepID=A0A9E8ZCD1_9CYAN|nr:hypothetical protein [Thermocoleostomius sinensis]WAL59309.1 hypothetical protein OXH18_19350 [Thermocoleostomius sinensis A174]
MADQEKVSNNGEATKVASTQSPKSENGKSDNGSKKSTESGLSLANANQAKASIEVSSYAVAGLRPIASSNLEVFGTILNNRPILASPLEVVSYAGNRPIFASEITVRSDFAGRPIVVSDPTLLQASLLPGGRPIASNEIDDSETLMGFID